MKCDKNIVSLHIAVMLFGLSGVVVQFINMPAPIITFGRVTCSALVLLVVSVVTKTPLRLKNIKDYMLITITGIIMAIHWTTFFQAIQVSSVAIGTITCATFPLFITFLEPIIFHNRLQFKNIVTAVILIIGVLITVPEFSITSQSTIGMIFGMISSFAYALMILSNRYLSTCYLGRTICFYEQAVASLVLLPTLFLFKPIWNVQDTIGILIIGFACTALAYSLYVAAQKNVSAHTAGIISGMETVYGIVYAVILLNEVPSFNEIVGGIVILGTIFLNTLKVKDVSS